MHYVKEMFDQLADLLEEYAPANDTPVSFEMKRHYLSMGQYAMWPRIYRVESFEVEVLADTNEYSFPAGAASGRLVFVETKSGDADAVYGMVPDDWYFIVPGPTDFIRLNGMPTDDYVGGSFRLTFTLPLQPIVAVDEAAAATEAFTGPDYSVEGPALYAMNRITARGLHNRLEYSRVSVQNANRAAVPNELMASSIFWLDEFERRVDMWQMVQPQSVR